MDCTPPSHRSNPRSASRLARVNHSGAESNRQPPNLSLDLVVSSPKNNNNDTPFPSPVSVRSSSSPIPLRELLLLSPSPLRKSRIRLADKLEMAVEEVAEPPGSVRKRCKTKGGQKGLLACASPRNTRRTRRRSEVVEMMKEEKEMSVVDETLKPRKRKTNVRSKKEKHNLVPSLPSPSSTSNPRDEDVGQGDLDRIGEVINDLVMWRDVAKSTLWFGFGCLCFLSSCFTKGVNFSIFSAGSQLGLLFLGASFFSNMLRQRNNVEKRREFQLREEDILRVARRVLPATNFAMSKTRELFSGEPSMTLKMTPFLLVGAEYGHLITLWRLCALGFFISFTVPKLYSCYAGQINQKVERMKKRIVVAWGACSHKKVVAFSAITAFWNLTSIRTRIFTAFIFLVILRYKRQNLQRSPEEDEPAEKQEEQPQPQPQPQSHPDQPEQQPQPQPQPQLQQEEQALVVVAETEGSKRL